MKTATPEQIERAERLLEMGGDSYLRYRILEDGSVAILCRLAFTKAIMLGVTEQDAYQRRFCFEDFNLVEEEFDKLQTQKDVPFGFIATRPQGGQRVPVDFKAWVSDYEWIHSKHWTGEFDKDTPAHPMDLMQLLSSVMLDRLADVRDCQHLHFICERRIDEMKIPRNLWTSMYLSATGANHHD